MEDNSSDLPRLHQVIQEALAVVPGGAKAQVDAQAVLVERASESGFDVSLARSEGRWLVKVGPWYGHFEEPSEALECFRGALSPETYLMTLERGSLPVRTDVHWPSGMVSSTSRLFSPFWRRKSLVTRRNRWQIVSDPESD